MNFSESRTASFAIRLLTIFALTLLLVFTARVLLENRELEKVVQHSESRSYALLFGYCVIILTSNYLYALRGRNLMDWKTELLVASNFIVLFAACTLPFLFPVETTSECRWYEVWCEPVVTRIANEKYFRLLWLLLPLLALTAFRIHLFSRRPAGI